MFSKAFLGLVALPALASAHFQLVYPPSRGTDDSNQYTGPCSSYAVSSNRTLVSTAGFPLSVDLEHDRSIISVLIAIGDDPASNFNTFVRPTVQEEGPGSFCFPSVVVPSSLNIANGTNATIQVITDGHNGGLYNCADVTFTTATLDSATSCTNGTGLTATYLANARTLANVTSSGGSSSSDDGNSTSTTSTSASGTGAAASATSSHASAAAALTVTWGVVGVAVLGAAALL